MLGLLGGALGAIGGFGGGSATKKAAALNKQELDAYLKSGTATIDTGQQQASGYLGDVSNLWKDYTDQGGGLSGMNLYGDALGVNGASGNAKAQQAFQTGPGYQFQMDQGINALNRSAAARGQLNSGQTSLDTLNFSQGLANNSWQQWLSNLSGFGGQQADILKTGTGGQAGSLSDLASLATGTAGQKVDLLGNVVNGRMAANNQTAAGTQQQYGGLAGLGSAVGGLFGGYL